MKIVTKKLLKNIKYNIGFNIYNSKNIPFIVLLIFFLLINTDSICQSFKIAQLKYNRVSSVYNKRIEGVKSVLQKNEIKLDQLEVLLLGTKLEGELNLYAKNKGDKEFVLIRKYSFCEMSGDLGPKRKEWDGQIPEGFYYINHFNPSSSYHLSLGINYPNKSDKALSDAKKLGDNIYIHGDCVTIGCIPITDYWIEELYIFCMEARNNGQKEIPVHIYPFEFDKEHDIKLNSFWLNLKVIYDHFKKFKTMVEIQVDVLGNYLIEDNGI